MSTTDAGGMVALQVKVLIQTTLGVARTKLSVNVPERLSRVTQIAEFSILLLSPRIFCFLILRNHFTDSVFSLA